jgi:hypothetical protein
MKLTRKTIVGVGVHPLELGLEAWLFDMQAHPLAPGPAPFTGNYGRFLLMIRNR